MDEPGIADRIQRADADLFEGAGYMRGVAIDRRGPRAQLVSILWTSVRRGDGIVCAAGVNIRSETAQRSGLGLANVSVEDPAATAEALRLCEQGLEFADALHIARSKPADRFVTFDEPLVKRAARVAPGRVGRA